MKGAIAPPRFPAFAALLAGALFAVLLVASLAGAPAAQAQGQAPGPAQGSRVQVDWAATDVTVGDRVPVEVSVVVPAGTVAGAETTPRFPAWRGTWGGAEILEVGEVEEIDPAALEARAVASAAAGDRSAGSGSGSGNEPAPRAWRQSLVLAAFRPGSVPLPPREILVPTAEGRSLRLTTPPDLALEVLSVLPVADEGEAAGGGEAPIPEPMDAKPMVALPVGAAFWWTAGAFALAILATALLDHRRRRPPRPAARRRAPPRPRHRPPGGQPGGGPGHRQPGAAPLPGAPPRLPRHGKHHHGDPAPPAPRRHPARHGGAVRRDPGRLRLGEVRPPAGDRGRRPPLGRRRLRGGRRARGPPAAQGGGRRGGRRGRAGTGGGGVNDLLPELLTPDAATWAAPHFVSPWWLLALAALPLLAWLHHRRGVRGALTYSRLPAPVRERSGAATALRLHLPFYCRLAALALLVVAAARPQIGYAWEESVTEGIDIQVVLDTSASMVVEDLPPSSRLTVAKDVVSRFIDGRQGDRIGLTVFSGSAVTRSPLTTDRRMLNELLRSLEVSRRLDGTAIGVGLASAAARLKDSEAESRVIILVTDGVNNTGSIDPASAAAICDGLGIRVYTVGIGREGDGVGLVRVLNQATGRYEVKRQQITARFDEELLRRIAERTGGAFFHATDAGSLERIFGRIDELEKTEMEVKRYVRYEESFQPLAWGALAFLLLPLGAAALRLTAEP